MATATKTICVHLCPSVVAIPRRLVTLLAALLIGACRPEPRPTAVDLGLGFADCFAPDTLSQRESGAALYKLGTACLERHQTDEAQRVAETIVAWQRGALLADTAAQLAQQGRTKDAQSLVRAAAAWAQELRARHREDNLGWTAERVAQHIAVAQSMLGQPSAATDRVARGQGNDLDGHLVETLLQRNPAATFDELIPATGALTNRFELAVQTGLAGGLLGWAENRPDLSTNELAGLAAWVQRTWPFQPAADQIAQRARLGQLLTTRGLATEGAVLQAEAERRAAALPPGYAGASVAVDLARRLAGTDPAAARQQMAAARERAAVCRPVDLPEALILLVRGWAALGDPARAVAALHEALTAADGLASPRPRLTAYVAICAAAHAALPEWPEPVAAALRQRLVREQARGRGAASP